MRAGFPSLALEIALTALTALAPWPAVAAEDEWSVGAGPLVASIPTEENGIFGVGAEAFVRYGVTASLGVELAAQYTYHVPAPSTPDGEPAADDPIQVIIPRAGVVYALDIIELVPYVLLDATLYVADEPFFGDGRTVGVGILGGLGLEYRRWRSVSFAVELGYHAFISDLGDYPVFVQLGLLGAWHNDPF